MKPCKPGILQSVASVALPHVRRQEGSADIHIYIWAVTVWDQAAPGSVLWLVCPAPSTLRLQLGRLVLPSWVGSACSWVPNVMNFWQQRYGTMSHDTDAHVLRGLDVCLCLLSIHGSEVEGYTACCSGDLVLILVVHGADATGGVGVYAKNLRTRKSGWLKFYDHLHLRVVTCTGDIDALTQSAAPAGAGSPERSAPHFVTQCAHCSNMVHSCYIHQDTEESSWCLQAQGWHCKKGRWRCPQHHWQPMNCQLCDLGQLCLQNGHGILQHPFEMASLRSFIENNLDVHVAKMMEFGFIYNWHHIELGGAYPACSPTQWSFGSEGSRIFSKLDMWRPCKDWSNRRWCELALSMPKSTFQLRHESARNNTLASWLECLVGLITVIGTSAFFCPRGTFWR